MGMTNRTRVSQRMSQHIIPLKLPLRMVTSENENLSSCYVYNTE